MEELIKITRTLIVLGKKNLNGRTYLDDDNLHEAISEYNDRAERFGGFGEIGYPQTFDISLSRASHGVKNVRVEGNKVVGEISVLNTKPGEELQKVLENTEFRPRSTGTVNSEGEVLIERIFAFDAIAKEDDSFRDME
jgi:hypothetical protein